MTMMTQRFLLSVSLVGFFVSISVAEQGSTANKATNNVATQPALHSKNGRKEHAISADVFVDSHQNVNAKSPNNTNAMPAKKPQPVNVAPAQKPAAPNTGPADIITPPETPVKATVPGRGKRVSNIEEAFVSTYLTNPDINAQRYQVRAQDEAVAVAKSGYRPRINFNSGVSYNRKYNAGDGVSAQAGLPYERASTNFPTRVDTRSTNAGVNIKQNVIQGGKTIADTNAANSSVMFERARLDAIEQKALLDTLTGFADVINRAAQLDLQNSNKEFLSKNLEATQAKFDVGEETLTSLAQSKGDQAEAVARVQTANGQVESQKAVFTRITGLELTQHLTEPRIPKGIPNTLKEAVDLALANNPSIRAAKFELEIARFGVDQARSGLLPSLDLTAGATKSWDRTKRRYNFAVPSSAAGYVTNDHSRATDYNAAAQLTVPIYEAGEFRARTRQAHEIVEVKRVALELATRQVIETLTASWNQMMAAKESSKEYKEQVEANKVSLEGTSQEVAVGSKIILDYLNAQRRLVESTGNYINAKRDYLVACYQVLAGIGALTVKNLGLNVGVYNPVPHYNDTKDRWF